MTILLLSVAGFVLYLVYERVRIDRWRQCVPQTIIVTGTRGKSSVIRMLASVLKADGKRILAKTTGSSPNLLWPDGMETEIRRRGPASILEQKALLKKAAELDVDILLAEVMSIHPENHYVESQQILKPDIVVVTNTRPDHCAAQGESENDIAGTLSLDIPNGATVFAPEGSGLNVLQAAADRTFSRVVRVADGSGSSVMDQSLEIANTMFAENVDIVHTVARHLGINGRTVADGLSATLADTGTFSFRELRAANQQKRIYFVNAFAANDPESTLRVLDKAKRLLPTASQFVGLLCLRFDRADRTVQWIEALRNDVSDKFSKLYVTGGHSRVVARKLVSAERLTDKSAARLTASIVADADDGTVVFGFGNFVGIGCKLAEHWHREGVAHGI